MAPAVIGSQMLSHSAFLDNLLPSHTAEILLPVELCMGGGEIKDNSGIKTKAATHVCEKQNKTAHTVPRRGTDDLRFFWQILFQC